MLNVIKSAAKELKHTMEKIIYQDPWKTQEGGNHYKNFKIQPADFIHADTGRKEGCRICARHSITLNC
jgi:hypothetical protein